MLCYVAVLCYVSITSYVMPWQVMSCYVKLWYLLFIFTLCYVMVMLCCVVCQCYDSELCHVFYKVMLSDMFMLCHDSMLYYVMCRSYVILYVMVCNVAMLCDVPMLCYVTFICYHMLCYVSC